MNKSIYETAWESYSHIKTTVQNKNYELSFEEQVEHLANIVRALKHAEKQDKLLEQQIIYLKNVKKDLEIDIEYYEHKINILNEKIILLEVENTKLKSKIKELENEK